MNRHGEERRHEGRQPLPGVFLLIEQLEGSGEGPWDVSVIDISRDGIAVALPSELEPDQSVLATLRVEGRAVLSRVPGRIVWHNEALKIGALQLDPLSDEDRGHLEQLLAALDDPRPAPDAGEAGGS